MSNEFWVILLPLIGVIIGSAMTFIGGLLSKRQERKAQVYKLLIEKRIAAYERIYDVTKSFQLGTYKVVDGEKLSRPMVLAKDANSFNHFFLHFIEATRNNKHLIDSELRRKTL